MQMCRAGAFDSGNGPVIGTLPALVLNRNHRMYRNVFIDKVAS